MNFELQYLQGRVISGPTPPNESCKTQSDVLQLRYPKESRWVAAYLKLSSSNLFFAMLCSFHSFAVASPTTPLL